jgi:hypothetical protein
MGSGLKGVGADLRDDDFTDAGGAGGRGSSGDGEGVGGTQECVETETQFAVLHGCFLSLSRTAVSVTRRSGGCLRKRRASV